jgi:predicted nucleic acid-binding protein
MLELNEIRSKNIVIDTNILIHYSTEGFIELSNNPLRTLANNDNNLVIPPIVAFELLRSDNRDDVLEKYLNLLNFLPTLPMHQLYYNNAARLSRLYRKVCDGKKPPVEDLLIGGIVATQSVSGGESPTLLMTADRNDFCEPLWQTVSQIIVMDDGDEKVRTIIYILEFNIELAETIITTMKTFSSDT